MTQVSSTADPPSAWLIDGKTTAGPVKHKGMRIPVRQAANNCPHRLALDDA
ncbi:hypothetical protein TOC8171_37700 [Pseudomonas syringae]|nr:hypothetical protein GCM10009085_02260 [Pseudomonas avellanae]